MQYDLTTILGAVRELYYATKCLYTAIRYEFDAEHNINPLDKNL